MQGIANTVLLIRALYVRSSKREKHVYKTPLEPRMTPDSTFRPPRAVTAFT